MTDSGVTLIEVVVSLLILTIGAMGLAAGIANAQRGHDRALAMGLALATAEAWLESWRAGPSRGTASGGEPVSWGPRGGWLEWSTRETRPCLEEARVEVRAGPRDTVVVDLVSRRYRIGATC